MSQETYVLLENSVHISREAAEKPQGSDVMVKESETRVQHN
jgi:hypothetical protein